MGALIAGALAWLLQQVLNAATQMVSQWLVDMMRYAATYAQSPAVQAMAHTATAAAAGLLALVTAWRGFAEYLVWQDGSGRDLTGLDVWRGVVAAAAGIAGGGTLVWMAFRWGLGLAAAFAGVRVLNQAVTWESVMLHAVIAAAFGAVQLLIVLAVYAVLLVAIVLVAVQSGIRAAELAFYLVAAPLFALGLAFRGGRVWWQFFGNVLVLGASQAVVIVALRLGSAVMAGWGRTPGDLLMAPLVYLGFLWVALRGPHMLQQYVWHSGLGETVILPIGRGVIGGLGRGGGGQGGGGGR